MIVFIVSFVHAMLPTPMTVFATEPSRVGSGILHPDCHNLNCNADGSTLLSRIGCSSCDGSSPGNSNSSFGKSHRASLPSVNALRLERHHPWTILLSAKLFMVDCLEQLMSTKRLFVALLSLLVCAPSYAGAALDDTISIIQEQKVNGKDFDDEMLKREIELFRAAEVSLRQALKIADGLHVGSRIVDIGFEGGSGSPVYRVTTFQEDRIWEDAIDAKTGQVVGNTIVSSMSELDLEDRLNLIALQSVRQELSDAVLVAEGNTSGKAISGGLLNEAGKLNFVILVLAGNNLKQVILEPPNANDLESLRRRAR
jgi:uncharacterized membrane protein YkoI